MEYETSLEGRSDDRSAPVKLADHFAASDRFMNLFSYGMDLVEETASFLDTRGRDASKQLSKPAMGMYGAESMRLTTRLMQLASWLLLQRAVAEGEMTVEQAISEKKNVKLNQLQPRTDDANWTELPEEFIDLVNRSVSLQRRIQQLDNQIYGDSTEEPQEPRNVVATQHALLETAFDRRFSR